MSEREKISRYFTAAGHGDVAERLLDLADAVRHGRPFAVSDFHTPFAGQIAMTIRAHFPELEAEENGGYPGAERIKVAFKQIDFAGDIDWNIGAAEISWDPRYRLIGHRDVLGSLMGLGLERDVFGDIIMRPSGAQVIVDANLLPFLKRELTKVSVVGVDLEIIELADIIPKEEKSKEIKTTVASLRLDAVGASGFRMSRSKMAAAIAAERVQVNWQRAKGAAQTVQVGDVISFRGRGRVVLTEITGKSRKGRIGVLLERYM